MMAGNVYLFQGFLNNNCTENEDSKRVVNRTGVPKGDWENT